MAAKRRRRRRAVWLLLVCYAIAACGPAAAPQFTATGTVCISEFCVEYPLGWEVVEEGERFVTFRHPDVEGAVATVGRVGLEGIASTAGAPWPQQPRRVVELLWELLDGGQAELGRIDLVAGGAYDSAGAIDGGRLWHRLVPVTPSQGIGVEVRAPSRAWEEHADVFRQGLEVLVDS